LFPYLNIPYYCPVAIARGNIAQGDIVLIPSQRDDSKFLLRFIVLD